MKSTPSGLSRPPAFDLQGVTFSYRGRDAPALDSVTLRVEEGRSLALLGPSGAGKSTLCRTLNGLIPHIQTGELSGNVSVLGLDTIRSSMAELARGVGLVFQDFESQLFATSVELEVAFAPENFGVPSDEIRQRVSQSLRAVGLEGREHRHPAALSGGEKQRLAIAAVLAGAPDILVLDEATTDLDPAGKAAVLAVLAALAEDEQTKPATVVLATSDAEEADITQRAVVLRSGRLEIDGLARDILADPAALEAHGVRPADLPALFAALGLPERPHQVEEALAALRRRDIGVNHDAWQRLARRETDRSTAHEPLVEVAGLHHSYPDGTHALFGADLLLRRGDFLAIVGQNGSGKTTLAKHLNRLLEPTEGEIRVGGRPLQAWNRVDLAQQVGYVFQNPDHQIFADTVFDEVAFGPRNFGLPSAEVEAHVRQALEAVQLAGRGEEDPFSLTKGERQRVAVASMLAARPDIMVFDEPTTGLDYRESRSMMGLISDLHEAGHTIVIITHSMWVVAEYAQRAVVMHQGRIVADEPVRSILGQPEALARASLVAPPIARLGADLGCPFRSVAEATHLLRNG